jgi:hypothetical protein
MTDGLMTRFAIVAYKGKILDTNCAKAKLLGSTAICTVAVGWQSSQLAYFLLRWGQGHIGFSTMYG